MTEPAYETVLSDLETKIIADQEPELEAQLSINDWIDRVRGAAQTAHSAARMGSTKLEYDTWIDLAAIALRRANIVLIAQTE